MKRYLAAPAILLLLVVGCGGPTKLMPTPNLYAKDGRDPGFRAA